MQSMLLQGVRMPAVTREDNEAGMWQAGLEDDQDESSSSSDDGEFQVSCQLLSWSMLTVCCRHAEDSPDCNWSMHIAVHVVTLHCVH